uniref:Peptidase C14 caspase domain-containing protein n=1 Tax=Zooxanthella nutricula TaxID=1333877 RepID=A0A7S2MZQ4_9DINO|mmetsp:Transcript_1520/g.4464  ORF Transcript_1520/g.4464 Transcript_1520/m.4464 type:complete len:653 (+) Transcript_1520:110-2068(+)
MGQCSSNAGAAVPPVERAVGSGRKRALLVGINYPGSRAQLSGCVNDITNQKAALLEHSSFDEGEMCVLADEGSVELPTKSNIMAGLKWLLEGARAGDLLVFHYSGHGSQCPWGGVMADCICPCDCLDKAWPGAVILDTEINEALYAPLPRGCKVVAIFDCCHSGTVANLPVTVRQDGLTNNDPSSARELGGVSTRDQSLSGQRIVSRYMAPPETARASKVMARPFTSGVHGQVGSGRYNDHQLWVFSGCQDNQTSADAWINGVPQGAFTWSLLKALRQASHQAAHIDVLEDARTILKHGGYKQSPVLSTTHQPYLRYTYMGKPLAYKRAEDVVLDSAVPRTKKALLVGINYIGTPNELRGCINDVSTHKEILTREFGFAAGDFMTLTEDEPKENWPYKARIIEGLKWLVQGAVRGDVLYFAYSGHGSQMPDRPDRTGMEASGLSDVICPLDVAYGLFRQNVILDTEIHNYVFDQLPEGVRLTCVFDCCHSGTVANLSVKREIFPAPELYRVARHIPWPEEEPASTAIVPNAGPGPVGEAAEKRARGFRKAVVEPPALRSAHHVWVYSGCQDSQTSADAYEDGKFQGAFTWAMSKALSGSRYSIVYMDFLLRAREILAAHGYVQVPALSTSQVEFLEYYFLGKTKKGGKCRAA